MAIKDVFGRAVRAGATAVDALAEESRRRERRNRHVEQARQELRDAAARARAARGGPGTAGAHGAWQAGDPTGTAQQTGSAPRDQSGKVFRFRDKVVADYYETLEVSPRARPAVIDKAYRALMREVHPDQGGDARKAQLVNEAYEVLRDPVTRREYDSQNGLT